jgi:hypothetical protein
LKNSKYWLFHLLLVVLVATACEQSAPNLTDIEESSQSISPNYSLLYTNLALSINEIENAINKQFENVIYEDLDYVKRESSKIKIRIEKTDDIEIFNTEGKLGYKLPIKLSGRVLINETLFGVKIRAEPQFTLEATLILSSDIQIKDDLKVLIATKVEEIIWPSRPVIIAGSLKVDLSPAIEAVIYSNENHISKTIQNEVNKRLILKDKVLSQSVRLKRNHYLNAKNTNLWLEVNPVEFLIAKKPSITNDSIVFDLGLKMLIGIGSKAGNSEIIDLSKVPIRSVSEVPEEFEVKIKMSIPYQQIDTILNERINQINTSDKLQGLRIGEVHSGLYHNNQFYIISEYSGRFKGKIFAAGSLSYDSISQSIELSEMDIYSYDNSFYTRVIFWIFGSNIIDEVTERASLPINPFFEKVHLSIQNSIERLRRDGEMELKLKDLNFKVTEIILLKDRVEIEIKLSGKSGMKYHIN